MLKKLIFALLAAALAAVIFRPAVVKMLQERNERSDENAY